MEERRLFPRQGVEKRARVLFHENKPPLDCILFDLTNQGAGLQLALNLTAPKWFELSFDNFRSSRYCCLAWQNGEKLGVYFLDRAASILAQDRTSAASALLPQFE